MSHNDKIKDMDAFFEVNPITRQIINKTPTKIVLMQGDHNSERFTFSLPRYIEGHDMAESAKANLHYINASKNVKGMYEMKDLKVDPDNPDNVICSWLISGNATKEAGALSFMIEFECLEGDVLVYSWHTLPHNGISVGEGFDNAEEIAEMYADVLQQWYNEIRIGKNTEYGGVVLGNTKKSKAYSPRSIAAGEGATAGTRGYKMLSLAESGVESEYSTIEVASKNGLEVGQRVSICGISTYVDVGTIQGIDANSTSTDTFVVRVKLDEPKTINCDVNDVLNYFTVVGRPDLGDIDIGVNAWAVGEECIALERDSFACGIQTIAIGKYSSAFGVETIAFGHESHAEGHGSEAKGCTSHAEGVRTIASGSFSHAEGMNSKAEGTVSHAEGHSTIASGAYSHAEGIKSVASGDYSHAEGSSSKAEGVNSHAEGYISTASGNYSHAEGGMTTASGAYSHAEGVNTVSSGAKSHAEGNGTVAASENQHVEGKFNIPDSEGRYAHIVGNGTHANNRKNAHTLDWKGNAWYAGTVECASVILTSPNGTKFKLTVADDGTLTTAKV